MSEFEVHAQVYGEVLHVLSRLGIAVGETPDAVHAQQAEDIFDAEAHFDVRVRDRRHAAGEEQRSLRVGQTAVVLLRERAPHALADQHFAPLEFLDERNAAQQDAVEVVFEEERHPCVRCEFVEIHAREGIGIVEVGAVAFVELEQRIGDLAEDFAALQRDVGIAQRRQFGFVVDAPFEPVVFVAVVQHGGNAGRESERQDGVDRAHVLLVEGQAVDALVLRNTHPDVQRGVRYGVYDPAVGTHQRHVAVAEDLLDAGAEEIAGAVAPFVFVADLAAVDHRKPGVAAREQRAEDVALRERVLSRAELHHVVPARNGELACQAAVEGQFDAAAALEHAVARAVGRISGETYAFADGRGRAESRLHAEPFEFVEAGQFVIGADADVFGVPVTDDHGVDERVDVAVERHVLHRIDHRVDALLLLAQPVGAHLFPEGFVRAADSLFVADDDVVVHARDFVGNGNPDAHVGVDHFARADERGQLRRVARGDRKFGRHPVAVAEPRAVGDDAVVVFEPQVLDPVYIDALRHARRGRLQGVRRRVDIDFAVEYGRGEPLGMEADFVGFAPLHLHAVHQKIVVEGQTRIGERTGEADVEDVDVIGVEIDVAVHLARELGDGEAVFDARHAAGADDFARNGGVAPAVVIVGRSFGDHGRQVGLSGECRGVDVVEDEPEIALQALAAEPGLDIRQVELHLGVGGAGVAVVQVGIVLGLAADDAPQDRMRRVVAGGDDDAADTELHGFEGEVDLVEAALHERLGLRGVADHRGLHAAHRVAGFERVDARLVGGDARRGAGKDDAHELHRRAVGGVGDAPADTGALRRQDGGEEQNRDEKGERFVCDFSAKHLTNVAKMRQSG